MKSLKQIFTDLLIYHEDNNQYDFILPETKEEQADLNHNYNVPTSFSNVEAKVPEPENVSTNLTENLTFMKTKYNSMINSDIVIREFTLTAKDKTFPAFILYIDGMVDSTLINQFILDPLMLRNLANSYPGKQEVLSDPITNTTLVRKVSKWNLADYVYQSLIPQNSVKQIKAFSEIISGINSGNCALFIDTISIAFDIEVKGFKQRGIEKPNNEVVVRGSQESFTEPIRTNTSLIRRIINNENLIIENVEVGKISKTKCAVCYLRNVANSELVAEVKFRLNNVDIDYLTSSGQLEQLIEDNSRYSIPQMIGTERPDKASNYILEGRVLIIVNGSPYALIAPATLFDFMSTPEDYNIKYQFSNMLKILRFLAVIISLLLPGIYIAVANFHQELIPTELLFTITASRETVPFPIIFEILVMEISFELIREAGLRVPTPIGPTIGIVGALVLGQAAVDANLVSPILIIIVALTGISSFAIPDFSFGFHIRLYRFFYIILGYAIGLLGIAFGLSIHLLIMCSLKSFGALYLQPYTPFVERKGLFLSPPWRREDRDDFLNVKRQNRQGKISMKWKYKQP